MCTSSELKAAHEKYLATKQRLQEVSDDPTLCSRYAKEANDAWLEFKKLNVEYENYSIMKQLNELYGC